MDYLSDLSIHPPTSPLYASGSLLRHTHTLGGWPQKRTRGDGLKRNYYLRLSGFCFCKGWCLGERSFNVLLVSALSRQWEISMPAAVVRAELDNWPSQKVCTWVGFLDVQRILVWTLLASEVEVIKNQCYFPPFLFPLIWWAPRASGVIKK